MDNEELTLFRDMAHRAFEQEMRNQEVRDRVKPLREAFNRGATRPLEYRIQQLMSFPAAE